MTTWELASKAEVEELRVLLRRVQRAGLDDSALMQMEEGFIKITKKEAGVMRTRLREMLEGEGRGKS